MRKQKWICGALLCVNILFIWGNSLLDGETSGEISGGLMQWLAGIFGGAGSGGELLLRKLGHFSEFACLGLLLGWFVTLLGQKGFVHRFAMPLLCGMTTACVDETIQIFVPDRGPSLIDVWIDVGGVCAGLSLLLFGYYLRRKRNKTITLEEIKK